MRATLFAIVIFAAISSASSGCFASEATPILTWERVPAELPDEPWAELNQEQLFKDARPEHIRRLAVDAFINENEALRTKAYYFLKAMFNDWIPKIPNLQEHRAMVQDTVLAMHDHKDARVRLGIVQMSTLLIKCERTVKDVSKIIRRLLDDPEPDIRLAALRTALSYQTGYAGGCIIYGKQTSYDLKQIGDETMRLFKRDPDARVRAQSLLILAELGPINALELLGIYLRNADRQQEMKELSHSVHYLLRKTSRNSEQLTSYKQDDFLKFLFHGSATEQRNGLALYYEWYSGTNSTLPQKVILELTIDLLKHDPEVRAECMKNIAAAWSIGLEGDPKKYANDGFRNLLIEQLQKVFMNEK